MADENEIDLHSVALRPKFLTFLMHFLIVGCEVEAEECLRVMWLF